MKTIKTVLLAAAAVLFLCSFGGCGNVSAEAPAVTCSECGNGSLACDGPISACMNAPCAVEGTSLGEAVTLDSGRYTLSSPNGSATGTFTVTPDGKGLVLRDSVVPVASELGVYQGACPYADAAGTGGASGGGTGGSPGTGGNAAPGAGGAAGGGSGTVGADAGIPSGFVPCPPHVPLSGCPAGTVPAGADGSCPTGTALVALFDICVPSDAGS